MKKTIQLIILVFLLNAVTQAQNDEGKLQDEGRISITAYVPQQVENIPLSALDLLTNRLQMVITKNGLSTSNGIPRFIATAHVSVLSKEITPTAPPMHALTLEVTFYLVDAYEQTVFSQTTTTLKGVGKNETKAYIAAVKNIRANDGRLKNWLERGKEKILEYYNTQCDFILKQAETLAGLEQYDEAMYLLSSVPLVSLECYNECMEKLPEIYALSQNEVAVDTTIEEPQEIIVEHVGETITEVEPTEKEIKPIEKEKVIKPKTEKAKAKARDYGKKVASKELDWLNK